MENEKIGSYRWRDALSQRAVVFKNKEKGTIGYRILWYSWSADIWFGRFPLLKFIIGGNILLWVIFFRF